MPQISNIAVNGNPKVGKARITPPALTTSLTFSDPQLFGCLGRAMAYACHRVIPGRQLARSRKRAG